jgi:hypothetical protein
VAPVGPVGPLDTNTSTMTTGSVMAEMTAASDMA